MLINYKKLRVIRVAEYLFYSFRFILPSSLICTSCKLDQVYSKMREEDPYNHFLNEAFRQATELLIKKNEESANARTKFFHKTDVCAEEYKKQFGHAIDIVAAWNAPMCDDLDRYMFLVKNGLAG